MDNGSIHNFSGIYKTKTSASPFYDNSSVYIQYHGSRKNTHFFITEKLITKEKNRMIKKTNLEIFVFNLSYFFFL